MNDIYAICPACKQVMALPDADRIYNCIACEAKPALLHTTDLFKACGEITEGEPAKILRGLLVALEGAIWKEMNNGSNSLQG